MGRIHYEIGVRMRTGWSSSWILARWQVPAAIVVVTLLGFAVGQYGATQNSELAHRQNRGTTNSSDQLLGRSSRLRVRPAEALVPTASPSVDAPAINQSTQPSSVVQSTNDSITVADSVTASTTAADIATTVETVPTSPATAPVTVPAPDTTLIPVAPPQPQPVVTVSLSPPLPVIALPVASSAGLDTATKKDVAMQLVSSAENSSLDWKAQYSYIEDIKDGRGYTGGIIGFCSGTGDMLELVQYYTKLAPSNSLAAYIPALQRVNGTASHAGLDPGFTAAWKTAATDPKFQQAQNDERDRVYFNPAVSQAKADGLRALGQFMYYDAIVMHGPGDDPTSFGGIRAAAMKQARTPAQGGDEKTYLNAFLDARVAAMLTEAAHNDVDRVETEQRMFLQAGNLDLNTPLTWSVYGDPYKIQ